MIVLKIVGRGDEIKVHGEESEIFKFEIACNQLKS